MTAHTSMPSKQSELPRLEPCTSIAGMELWSQCYERWLLPLDAPHAGPVQYHVFNYAVLQEVSSLAVMVAWYLKVTTLTK